MPTLIHRIKERHLWRTLIGYPAGAFVLLEGLELFIELFGWNQRLLVLSLILLAGGLPMTLIWNWYHGPRGVQQVRRVELMVYFVIGTLTLTAAGWYGVTHLMQRANHPAVAAAESVRSIAILPFRNLSADAEVQYFADGVGEMIRNQLARVDRLQVTSMTSVEKYREASLTLPQIAAELQVDFVLEGSIMRDGNHIRLVAQLIDAGADTHLWSQVFDREFTEIFDLQRELTQLITTSLRVELSPPQAQRIFASGTKSAEAYDLYLAGADRVTRYTREDNEAARALFKQALALDPRYHAALAGLAQTYLAGFSRYGEGTEALLDSTIELSEQAIALQPHLPEGYFALALAYNRKGWLDRALDAFLKTVERAPSHSAAIANIGLVYYGRGELDEAMRWYQRAIELEPDSYSLINNIGVIYGYLGMPRIAEDWFMRAKALRPNASQAFIGLAHLYIATGDTAAAHRVADSLKILTADVPALWENIGDIYRMTGRNEDARDAFERHLATLTELESDWYSLSPPGLGMLLYPTAQRERAGQLLDVAGRAREAALASGNQNKWICSDLAAMAFTRGDAASGVGWVRRAIGLGWCDLHFARRDPAFKPWLEHPEFTRQFEALETRLEAMREEVLRLEGHASM